MMLYLVFNKGMYSFDVKINFFWPSVCVRLNVKEINKKLTADKFVSKAKSLLLDTKGALGATFAPAAYAYVA